MLLLWDRGFLSYKLVAQVLLQGAHLLARSADDDSAVALCSHGDVIWELLRDLEEAGVPLSPGMPAKKGSTWRLEVRNGAIVRGTYLPPPTA